MQPDEKICMAAGIERRSVIERVTREKLEAYRSMKEEIAELRYKMEHLMDGDAMVGSSVIKDYRSGYPVPQAVVGVDWERYYRLRERYEYRICELEKECAEVEELIEEINDSMTRRIFRMYFLEGMSQKDVGRAVHMDRSRISRKIDDFLKNAHKAQKAQL